MLLSLLTLLLEICIILGLLETLRRFSLVNQSRDARFDQALVDVKRAISQAGVYEERIVEQQIILARMIEQLTSLLEEKSEYIATQQEQFTTLAKSDLLVARQNELMRAVELKTALERFVRIATSSRQAPATIDVLALESVNRRIDELRKILQLPD